MNQMFKSATFKLTIWYLCLAEFICLVFSIVVYNIGTREIYLGVIRQYQRIYDDFPVFDNNPLLRPDKDISSGDHDLLFKLLFLNIIVLILAGIVSYFLAKQTLKPIEEAHEQQKRFTADVSHELRTPLTAIRMEDEVALLNDQTDKKELKRIISSNLEEVGRLENMINSLLRLSSLEASAIKQQFALISSSDVSKEAISKVEKKAKQRKITINSKTDNIKFYGDSDSIVQLLSIVLDNAIKYSHPEGKIDFNVKSTSGQTIFSVVDNGIGIKEEALEHIFDRFYQADSSRAKKDNDGYGLGLSIAKNIADIHQAVIKVRSQFNKGTTVEIIFPPTSA